MDGPSERIAGDLRARILDGDLEPGDRLPSTRDLVGDYGVAMSTASRAVALLRQGGWVATVPRVGSVVADRSADARPPRSPGAAPDRDEMIAAAVRIADEEGLAALSMRRLGRALGVPTMTLYRQVRGRDDLVLLMVEAAFATSPIPPSRGGWRQRLEAVARLQWRVHGRHPWVARVLSMSRPQAVPALLRLAEFELAALEEVVSDPVRRFDLHVALTSFVRGMAADLAAEREAEQDTGVDADTWAGRDAALHEALQRDGGAALVRVGDYPYDLQRIFDTGLAAFLDGIEHAAQHTENG